MSDVVQQDGGLYGFRFAVKDEIAFGGEVLDRFAHQVESTQRVLETGMLCPRIYSRGQPQLLDAGKALQQWVAYNVV